ncbi:unnamed protein product, partial [marine sediment metagenome]
QNHETLEKFNDNPDNRKGVIIAKTVTVAMINKMLKILAQNYDNVVHVTYEDLCSNPVDQFKILTSFLTFERGYDFDNLLESSLNEEESSNNPYSIFRNTNAQLNRPFKFLKKEEVKLAIDILTTCNLQRGKEYVNCINGMFSQFTKNTAKQTYWESLRGSNVFKS